MKANGPNKRRQRVRRWVPLALTVAFVAVLGGIAYCWHENTIDLDISESTAGTVARGGTITIDLPKQNGCGSQPWELYREVYGRWQLTHQRIDGPEATEWVRVDEPVLRWPHSQKFFYAGHCYIGNAPTAMTVPADITWTRVAVCGEAASPCVEIKVDRP